MGQEYFLPSKEDWKKLSSIYKKLNHKAGYSIEANLQRNQVFGFHNAFIEAFELPAKLHRKDDENAYVPYLTDDFSKLSRLLLYIGEHFWSSCPLPVLNIIRQDGGRGEAGNSRRKFLDEFEHLSPILSNPDMNDFNRTSFNRFLNTLSKEGLIKSFTYNDWKNEFGEIAKIQKSSEYLIERGSSQVFPLTALGTFMYEHIIHTPMMFHSYLSAYYEPDLRESNDRTHALNRSQNRYNTTTTPLVTLSMALKDRKHLFVDSPFHSKESEKYVYHGYHEQINYEQRQILGVDLEFFIYIHNPATKIIREYKALLELFHFFELPFDSNLKNVSSGELLKNLFAEKIYADIALLEELWKDILGIKKINISEYLPEEAI